MVLCSLGLENESSERQRIRSPDQAGRDHKRVRLQSAVPSPRPITDEASASQRVTPPGRKPDEGGGRVATVWLANLTLPDYGRVARHPSTS